MIIIMLRQKYFFNLVCLAHLIVSAHGFIPFPKLNPDKDSINKNLTKGQNTMEFLKKHRQLLITGLTIIIGLIVLLALYRKCCKADSKFNESWQVMLLQRKKSCPTAAMKQNLEEVKVVQDSERNSVEMQNDVTKSSSLTKDPTVRDLQKDKMKKTSSQMTSTDAGNKCSIAGLDLLSAERIDDSAGVAHAVWEKIPVSGQYTLIQLPLSQIKLTGNQYEMEARLLNCQRVSQYHAQRKDQM